MKRCGKSAPAGQATGLARQTPPGARPRRKNDGQPSRAGPARKSFRVGRLKRRVTVALEKWPLSTEPGLSARFGLSFQPLACLLGLGRGRMTGPVFSTGPVRDINLSFWGDPPAPETEEAPRMRSRSTLSLLAVFVLRRRLRLHVAAPPRDHVHAGRQKAGGNSRRNPSGGERRTAGCRHQLHHQPHLALVEAFRRSRVE